MSRFLSTVSARAAVRTAALVLMLILSMSLRPALAESAAAQGKTPTRYKITIPYTTLRGLLPLVPVRLNNKLTTTFLIDTGANMTVVTDKVAQKLGLTPAPALQDGHPLTMLGQPAKFVTLAPCQVGSFLLPNVDMIVVPEQSISSTTGQPVGGIIGSNILGEFSILIDGPRHQMTLWFPAGMTASDLKDAGMEGASVVPLTLPPDTGQFLIPIQLQQGTRVVHETVMLDTGAGPTVISKKAAQQLHLDVVLQHVQLSVRGNFIADAARLTALRIGDIEVTDKLVDYPDSDSSTFPSVLGMDVLADYRVLLDFPSQKMYIQSAMPSVKIKPQ